MITLSALGSFLAMTTVPNPLLDGSAVHQIHFFEPRHTEWEDTVQDGRGTEPGTGNRRQQEPNRSGTEPRTGNSGTEPLEGS